MSALRSPAGRRASTSSSRGVRPAGFAKARGRDSLFAHPLDHRCGCAARAEFPELLDGDPPGWLIAACQCERGLIRTSDRAPHVARSSPFAGSRQAVGLRELVRGKLVAKTCLIAPIGKFPKDPTRPTPAYEFEHGPGLAGDRVVVADKPGRLGSGSRDHRGR